MTSKVFRDLLPFSNSDLQKALDIAACNGEFTYRSPFGDDDLEAAFIDNSKFDYQKLREAVKAAILALEQRHRVVLFARQSRMNNNLRGSSSEQIGAPDRPLYKYKNARGGTVTIVPPRVHIELVMQFRAS